MFHLMEYFSKKNTFVIIYSSSCFSKSVSIYFFFRAKNYIWNYVGNQTTFVTIEFHYLDEKTLSVSQSFIFQRRGKVIQFWNDVRVNDDRIVIFEWTVPLNLRVTLSFLLLTSYLRPWDWANAMSRSDAPSSLLLSLIVFAVVLAGSGDVIE